MHKILIPCDGSDNGLRVVRYAASLAIRLSDVQLELLNVQEPLPQKVHAALSEQVIARWQAGESDIILEPVRRILDAEEVQYKVRSRVGSPANEIALHVHETQCDAIIMGRPWPESDSQLGNRFGRHQGYLPGPGPGDSDQVSAARSPA